MIERKTVLALGFFDGIHVGHAELVNMAKKRSEEIGAEPAVMTFDIHPDTLIKGVAVPLINSAEDRAYILRSFFGVDNVYFLHFSEETMRMNWRVFLDEISQAYNVCHFIVGHDFSFGFKGEGNAERLSAYCEENGFGCDVIPAVIRDGEIVSSTNIRRLLLEGNVEKANELLGHNHLLSDHVRAGYRIGRTIEAPTINMVVPEGVLTPKHGVYCTRVRIDDEIHLAVTNVGSRPTFEGDNITVETNILDYSRTLYGEKVVVEFCSYIRPERKFDSADALSKQIRLDIEKTRQFFAE